MDATQRQQLGGSLVLIMVGALLSGTFVWALCPDCGVCTAPLVLTTSAWRSGDCVTTETVDGKPVDGWAVLRFQTDDGGWMGSRHSQSGVPWRTYSTISPLIYRKVPCPVIQDPQ